MLFAPSATKAGVSLSQFLHLWSVSAVLVFLSASVLPSRCPHLELLEPPPYSVCFLHRVFCCPLFHTTAFPAELRRHFSQFGKVASAQVMYNRETCKSRGFGFVIFEDEASVDLALTDRIHTIGEKAVRRFGPSHGAPRDLFVSRL